jgi:transcriptional regulator with XRE-family HTH domain
VTERSSGRRVTLTEVAERAGVSRSAASFALNGRLDQRLSVETMARVRRAADELGYRANVTAKTLRTGRSGTVALVSDFVSSTSFANSMVRGALERLREAGLLLFTVDTQGDAEMERRFLDDLVARDIDGILYASMFTRRVTPPASARHTALVLMNCEADDAAISSIVPDERAAGATAARLLREAGHDRDIWFVGTLAPGRTGGSAWHEWGPVALPRRLEGIRAQPPPRARSSPARSPWTTTGRCTTGGMPRSACSRPACARAPSSASTMPSGSACSRPSAERGCGCPTTCRSSPSTAACSPRRPIRSWSPCAFRRRRSAVAPPICCSPRRGRAPRARRDAGQRRRLDRRAAVLTGGIRSRIYPADGAKLLLAPVAISV